MADYKTTGLAALAAVFGSAGMSSGMTPHAKYAPKPTPTVSANHTKLDNVVAAEYSIREVYCKAIPDACLMEGARYYTPTIIKEGDVIVGNNIQYAGDLWISQYFANPQVTHVFKELDGKMIESRTGDPRRAFSFKYSAFETMLVSIKDEVKTVRLYDARFLEFVCKDKAYLIPISKTAVEGLKKAFD